MTRRSRAYLRTVRLRLGWAATPLYLAGGPVAVADSGLSADLATDLLSWEQRAWSVVLAEEPMAPAMLRRLRREVLALGARVAGELGREFRVHVLLGNGPRQYRVLRSREHATNAAARTNFLALAACARTWDRQVRHAVRDGLPLRWPPVPSGPG